eukprot:scaffold1954_cov268-Pinguiococcus_pyrenoidosus.AAC.168
MATASATRKSKKRMKPFGEGAVFRGRSKKGQRLESWKRNQGVAEALHEVDIPQDVGEGDVQKEPQVSTAHGHDDVLNGLDCAGILLSVRPDALQLKLHQAGHGFGRQCICEAIEDTEV